MHTLNAHIVRLRMTRNRWARVSQRDCGKRCAAGTSAKLRWAILPCVLPRSQILQTRGRRTELDFKISTTARGRVTGAVSIIMVRRRSCAVSNHEASILRDAAKWPLLGTRCATVKLCQKKFKSCARPPAATTAYSVARNNPPATYIFRFCDAASVWLTRTASSMVSAM